MANAFALCSPLTPVPTPPPVHLFQNGGSPVLTTLEPLFPEPTPQLRPGRYFVTRHVAAMPFDDTPPPPLLPPGVSHHDVFPNLAELIRPPSRHLPSPAPAPVPLPLHYRIPFVQPPPPPPLPPESDVALSKHNVVPTIKHESVTCLPAKLATQPTGPLERRNGLNPVKQSAHTSPNARGCATAHGSPSAHAGADKCAPVADRVRPMSVPDPAPANMAVVGSHGYIRPMPQVSRNGLPPDDMKPRVLPSTVVKNEGLSNSNAASTKRNHTKSDFVVWQMQGDNPKAKNNTQHAPEHRRYASSPPQIAAGQRNRSPTRDISPVQISPERMNASKFLHRQRAATPFRDTSSVLPHTPVPPLVPVQTHFALGQRRSAELGNSDIRRSSNWCLVAPSPSKRIPNATATTRNQLPPLFPATYRPSSPVTAKSPTRQLCNSIFATGTNAPWNSIHAARQAPNRGRHAPLMYRSSPTPRLRKAPAPLTVESTHFQIRKSAPAQRVCSSTCTRMVRNSSEDLRASFSSPDVQISVANPFKIIGRSQRELLPTIKENPCADCGRSSDFSASDQKKIIGCSPAVPAPDPQPRRAPRNDPQRVSDKTHELQHGVSSVRMAHPTQSSTSINTNTYKNSRRRYATMSTLLQQCSSIVQTNRQRTVGGYNRHEDYKPYSTPRRSSKRSPTRRPSVRGGMGSKVTSPTVTSQGSVSATSRHSTSNMSSKRTHSSLSDLPSIALSVKTCELGSNWSQDTAHRPHPENTKRNDLSPTVSLHDSARHRRALTQPHSKYSHTGFSFRAKDATQQIIKTLESQPQDNMQGNGINVQKSKINFPAHKRSSSQGLHSSKERVSPLSKRISACPIPKYIYQTRSDIRRAPPVKNVLYRTTRTYHQYGVNSSTRLTSFDERPQYLQNTYPSKTESKHHISKSRRFQKTTIVVPKERDYKSPDIKKEPEKFYTIAEQLFMNMDHDERHEATPYTPTDTPTSIEPSCEDLDKTPSLVIQGISLTEAKSGPVSTSKYLDSKVLNLTESLLRFADTKKSETRVDVNNRQEIAVHLQNQMPMKNISSIPPLRRSLISTLSFPCGGRLKSPNSDKISQTNIMNHDRRNQVGKSNISESQNENSAFSGRNHVKFCPTTGNVQCSANSGSSLISSASPTIVESKCSSRRKRKKSPPNANALKSLISTTTPSTCEQKPTQMRKPVCVQSEMINSAQRTEATKICSIEAPCTLGKTRISGGLNISPPEKKEPTSPPCTLKRKRFRKKPKKDLPRTTSEETDTGPKARRERPPCIRWKKSQNHTETCPPRNHPYGDSGQYLGLSLRRTDGVMDHFTPRTPASPPSVPPQKTCNPRTPRLPCPQPKRLPSEAPRPPTPLPPPTPPPCFCLREEAELWPSTPPSLPPMYQPLLKIPKLLSRGEESIPCFPLCSSTPLRCCMSMPVGTFPIRRFCWPWF